MCFEDSSTSRPDHNAFSPRSARWANKALITARSVGLRSLMTDGIRLKPLTPDSDLQSRRGTDG